VVERLLINMDRHRVSRTVTVKYRVTTKESFNFKIRFMEKYYTYK